MNNKLYIDGVEFTSTKNLDISFDNGEIPEYVTDIHNPLSASAEFSCECEVNPQLLAKVTGVDLSQLGDLATSFSLRCSSPYQVQKRRHKKKRINKKWAKRYGYVTKFTEVRLEEVSLVNEHHRDDILELEFVGRRNYIVC